MQPAVLNNVFRSGGAYAEYAVVPTKNLVPKPACLSFEEAAALPLAGTTVLQGNCCCSLTSRRNAFSFSAFSNFYFYFRFFCVLCATTGLRDHGKVKAGQKVLITGASGGCGSLAVASVPFSANPKKLLFTNHSTTALPKRWDVM